MKNFFIFSGIRAKATFYIVSLVVITFIIIGTVLFVSLFNTQNDLAVSEFQSLAAKHINNFEKEISSTLDYLSSVASALDFHFFENNPNRETLHRTIYYIFDSYDVNSSGVYFEPNAYDGKDEHYIGTAFGTAQSGRIGYYFYRYNNRTAYRQESLGGDVEFTMPVYTETKALRAPTYTAPGVYSIGGVDTLMFSIGYPIINRSTGEFFGVITADILLGTLYAELQEEEIYSTGYMIIANDKGQLIYSPRFEDIGRTRGEAGITYPLPPDGEEFGFFNSRSIINDKRTLVAGQTLYFPQIDSRFYISVAAPVSEIYAQGTQLLIIVVAVSLTIIILMAIFLYYLIGRFTKPLIEFSKSTHNIAQGDYSVRITGDYQDEFAVLKDSMNFMTERIENSFGMLQNMLNGINAFIYVTDLHTGKILFINEKMKEELGVTDDAIGHICYEVFSGLNNGICNMCPYLNNDSSETDQTPINMWESYDEESNRFYQNTSVYIDWLDSEKVSLQHSVDITDLKLVTEEKIKAEELSETKSVFLANMSHEVRTPMSSILGFTELALDDEISQKTRGYLTNIQENSKWLLNIINDILDISKIEAGRLELENIPFSMCELFSACRNMISPAANEKGIMLHFYAEPSVGKTPLGDPTRLRQIMTNILSNAVKFTNSGVVKIQSLIKESSDNTVTMQFEVKDSGIGMTSEQIDGIFDPFMQAESGTTRKYGGTGLGLAISKNLVEMMGGTLTVESTPGVGSKFIFELTFDTINADSEELHESMIIFDEFKKPTFEGEVLLCEDNPMNQQVITEHLTRVGLKTVVADNGAVGFEMVKNRMEWGKKQFDLIFMDVHMPVMDGLEAAAKISELNTGIPIVAMTANIMSNDREVYEQSNMVGYVGKPFTSQELWRCLMKFFTPVQWNVEDKTHRLEQDDALMQKLINNFVSKNTSKFNEIEDAINIGDIKLAHRLVHTLKSNAGQLKKTYLQQIADEVEDKLKDGINDVSNDLLELFKKELSSVLTELEPMVITPKSATATSEQFDSAAALKLLDVIEPILKDDNPDCFEFVDQLRKIPGSDELIRQMEDFDFALAAKTLASLRTQLMADA